ncbi:beta-lactam-binding protein with PASTA domain [Dyadobacter jejuensis]|uniref:Beta-lactam-binding protein with PASTA domain n=1 Tax=Dyadobacter jejuensis TaxID=1082580 RepID=A0A316AAD8_9BACT|nr:PASTA domain-containing protein [Dyadobacter jejuensis]PWJ54512.1 beta-lactam-binding protein with PASTA domain [Dyadobacter jejuensis]
MTKISTQSRSDLLIHIGIIIALILVFFLGFFFIYLPFTTNHGESITVPDLRKQPVTELDAFLDSRDLRYEVSDCTFVANVPPLTIISQYPAPGSKVKEGRKIYITVVSNTAPLIKMPKLTDMTHQSAQMSLKSVGLEEGTITYEPDMAQNAVLKQLYQGKEILPGQPVAKGSKIDLVLGEGLGTAQFNAPSVLDMPLDEAKIVIVGAGLKVGQLMELQPEDGQGGGIVVKQNPEGGYKVRIGDVIDLWVTPEANETESNEQPQGLQF